jgi:hypothetical protein
MLAAQQQAEAAKEAGKNIDRYESVPTVVSVVSVRVVADSLTHSLLGPPLHPHHMLQDGAVQGIYGVCLH